VAIRYPRGEGLGLDIKREFELIPIGQSRVERPGKHAAVLVIGDRVAPALEIASRLSKKQISLEVVNMRFVKPLDEAVLEDVTHRFKHIITIENNALIGGFGSAVAEWMSEKKSRKTMLHRFGLRDEFIPHGRLADLFDYTGLSIDALKSHIEKLIQH
jgi:1-deoxy-D-xylulose-5-phosphate synthase